MVVVASDRTKGMRKVFTCPPAGMDPHGEHLTKQLEEARRELDVARKPSEIRGAATKRRLALQGLQWLDEQERQARPKRRSSRGRGSEDAS